MLDLVCEDVFECIVLLLFWYLVGSLGWVSKLVKWFCSEVVFGDEIVFVEVKLCECDVWIEKVGCLCYMVELYLKVGKGGLCDL